jgi:predicted RNA-binding protein with PUA-like domain
VAGLVASAEKARRMPRHWLFKTEPDTFSIDDLRRVKREEWSGVRNYTARNLMREMRAGDLGFFYHSSTTPAGIAGMCEVVAEAHPDSTQFDRKSEYYDRNSKRDDPRWWCVDVRFVEKFPRLVTLAELRTVPELVGMALLRKGQRLSVQPVSDPEWDIIMRIAREASP